MCHPLVIASARPLPYLRYSRGEHDASNGQIYVSYFEDSKSRDSLVLFPTRFLYCISTGHTGDACGFSGDYGDAVTARIELAAFLDSSFEFSDDLQIYVAAGDYGDSGVLPTSLNDVGPSDIRSWMTVFNQGEFFQVIQEE